MVPRWEYSRNLPHPNVIEVGDRLLMGAGRYYLGAIASVLPDIETGIKYINDHRAGIETLNFGEPHLLAVEDPWKLMRRAAGEGLAGITGLRTDTFQEWFMFMVRVEDAGAILPTVLTSMRDIGWGPSLTRTGETHFPHAHVLHWQRFDILDRVSGLWSIHCPFRGWNHGDMLYEIRSDQLTVVLADVPVMGDWNSTEGAFAFFTNYEDARYYIEHSLGDGQNKMLSTEPGAPDDRDEAMTSLRPETVHDLRKRLVEFAEINPFAAWSINPNGHRENSGYGRLFDEEQHSMQSDSTGSDPTFRLIAVSGHWSLQPKNVFRLEISSAPWTGWDTIRWSGGQALQFINLDRSFAKDTVFEDIDLEDLTDSDAEAVVAQKLSMQYDMDAIWEGLPSWSEDPEGSLNHFRIIAWNTVMGEGADLPWRFPNVFDALCFFATHERLRDRSHRGAGASSWKYIGFSGSQDEEFENLRSERFRRGLHQIALRIIRHGYRPKDADDLVALCNGILKTLHVDVAGYPKDLLWASPNEQ